MGTAALLLADRGGSGVDGSVDMLAAPWGRHSVVSAALRNVLASGLEPVVVVTGSAGSAGAVDSAVAAIAAEFGPPGVSVVANEGWASGRATGLHCGVAAIRALGCDAAMVGLGVQPAVPAEDWRAVAASDAPIAVARFDGACRPPILLRAEVWDLLPTTGDASACDLISTHSDLVTEVAAMGDPRAVDTAADLLDAGDRRYVENCLGRPPRCDYAVAARAADGRPMVIVNEPFLSDGTPMPTLYWLVDPDLNRRLGTLEAAGGVKRAEAAIPVDVLADAHRRYAAERDARIGLDRPGPRPSGGVGGTRVGVKCLHTHYAWWLAGGEDPVAVWAADLLGGASR